MTERSPAAATSAAAKEFLGFPGNLILGYLIMIIFFFSLQVISIY